jgi:transposase
MSEQAILGIDIAKATFDVTLLQGAQQRQAGQFSNDSAGFKHLSSWLHKRKLKHVWACMEATGHYGDELAEYLHAEQHTVSIVNPAAIKAYSQSQLRRNKSDKLDAELIARFCQSERPAAWSPPAAEIRTLRELVHQYDNLQTARQQTRNRLAAGLRSSAVRAQLAAQLAFIEQQLKELKELIAEHIDQYPDLKRQHELLDSIPGLGALTTAKLIAVDLQRFGSARELAAYAGLTPMNRDSGSSVHRRAKLSKLGVADLRRACYMPSLTAIKRNPPAKAMYERLLANGKSKMAALGAVMHKLLRQAFGVLKSGLPFDADFAKKSALTA